MRMALAVLLNSLLILSVPTQLVAKGKTVKITISGAGLKAPIEITDPEILANFNVWARLIVDDWSQAPVREPPNTVRKYQVSFYAGEPDERIVYVVYYVFDRDAGPGYVFLPGKSDEWYRLNVHSIFRREEGKWFTAWNAWERVARPLIEKAENNRFNPTLRTPG